MERSDKKKVGKEKKMKINKEKITRSNIHLTSFLQSVYERKRERERRGIEFLFFNSPFFLFFSF